MEELLKMVYRNFICEEDENTSKELRIIREHTQSINDASERLEKMLNTELFIEISDLIYCGVADVQEAAFMAGFAQCAKFMSNGKIDFFANNN